MQNYIYNNTKIHYVLVRMNLETNKYEYFNGCNKYGTDGNGIPIVRHTLWSEEFHIARVSPYLNYLDRTLKGILKYNSSDKYHYYICECRINTIVDANAPVGNVTVK